MIIVSGTYSLAIASNLGPRSSELSVLFPDGPDPRTYLLVN